MARKHTLLKMALGLAVLALGASFLSAQPYKIRVKDPSAVIRMEPSATGEIVQDKVAVGTEFTADRKSGPWYEVKYRSAIGVLLTGYINESLVEVIKEESKPEPPPLKAEIAKEERTEAPVARRSGVELTLGGGMAFSNFSKGENAYTNTFSGLFLRTAADGGNLSLSMKNPATIGAGIAYFFSPSFGIQLRVDYQTKQQQSEGISNYTLAWTWNDGRTGSQQATFPYSAEMSILPISLDGVLKFDLGNAFNGYLNAGVSYFTSTFKANTDIGYGTTFTTTSGLLLTQHVDFVHMPANINETLNGIGFNAGLGLQFLIGSGIGAFIEADYFGGPSKTVKWAIPAGTFPFVLDDGFSLIMTASDTSKVAGRISSFDINASFFKFQAGIKIGL